MGREGAPDAGDELRSPLRLARFLREQRSEIILAWVEEISAIRSGRHLSRLALRNNVDGLLESLARTLDADGRADVEAELGSHPDAHALTRLGQGYELKEVIAEYSMLRSTIERLWRSTAPTLTGDRRDLVLLGRSIDVAIGASVDRFVQTRERTLIAIDRMSAAAIESGDRESFLPRLLDVLMETTQAVDSAVILLCEKGQLRLKARSGLPPVNPEDAWFPIDEGFVGSIAKDGFSRALRDACADASVKCPALCAEGTRALFGVPLSSGGKQVGVALMGSRSAWEFSAEDQLLFRSMALRATSLLLQLELLQREREATALLDTLLVASPLGVAILDEELRYVRVNEALARVNGRPIEAHLGRTVAEVVKEAAASVLVPLLRSVLATGVPLHNYEFATESPMDPDDERTWLGNFYPVRIAGDIRGIGAMVVDITDRKRAADEAHRRAAELDAVLASIPEAVYVGDLNGIQRANTSALEQLGFATFEELKHDVSTLAERIETRDAVTGVRLRIEEEPFVRALQGEVNAREVLIHHLKTGEDRVVRCSAAPIRLNDEVSGAVAINIDVTEQKRNEELLRTKEQRLILALDAAQAGLFDDDLVTSELHWDARARALFGIGSRTPMTVELATRATHPEDRESVLEAIGAAADPLRRTPFRMEYRTVGIEDGVERWVSARGRCVFSPEGRPLRFIGTLIDITARKQTEMELERTAQFREQFISVLGHDLRTPLSVIRASTELLLRNENLQPGQTKGLLRIIKGSDRMTRMIADVLDFARGRLGGGFPLETQRINLHDVSRNVIEEMQVAHPDRELSFEAKGDGWGEWDPDRVAQVVNNLVGNALQHGAADSPVRLVLCAEGESLVRMEVRSQGRPIPPELLRTLFEPFRGAQASGTGAERSLGLGLYIVCEIVRAHRGRIEVVSNAHDGTIFSVMWPRD